VVPRGTRLPDNFHFLYAPHKRKLSSFSQLNSGEKSLQRLVSIAKAMLAGHGKEEALFLLLEIGRANRDHHHSCNFRTLALGTS